MDEEAELHNSSEFRPAALSAGAENLPPQFVNVIHFVERRLVRLYRRDAATNKRRWCPEWWRHSEAVHRMFAVWRAYEFLRRSEDGLAMSNWWVIVDRNMKELLAPDGPFERCSIRGGHSDGNEEGNPHDGLTPLPVVPANSTAFAGYNAWGDDTDTTM